MRVNNNKYNVEEGKAIQDATWLYVPHLARELSDIEVYQQILENIMTFE